MRAFRTLLVVLAALAMCAPGARAEDPKGCVGNPPRQTEDPLSPPCVPFYDGDNGGETAVGVTATEIKVALYNDLGVNGDMNLPYTTDDDSPETQTSNERRDLVRTIKAQLRYFLSRYQTYGRTVRVIAKASAGVGTPCPQRQSDSYVVRKNINPFANVTLGDNFECYVASMARDWKVPSFTYGSDLPRKTLEDNAGYIWSFLPDQETEAGYSASFICRELAGGRARFARDDSLRSQLRKFGIIYPPPDSQRGPAMYELAQLLAQRVKNRCGVKLIQEAFAGGGQAEAITVMQDLQNRGVTTVICYCVPVQTESTVTTMQKAARVLNYQPEWYWDHASRMDKAMWERNFGDPTQSSFGVSYYWRQPAFAAQIATRAFKEADPSGSLNERFNFQIYHSLLLLFTAIQDAGPDLTPESVNNGLLTWTQLDRTSPYVPVGGFGAYVPNAPGLHSFVDSAVAWWWDPAGTEPGGSPLSPGCVRVAAEGASFFTGEWPLGDGNLFDVEAPCTAANQHSSLVGPLAIL